MISSAFESKRKSPVPLNDQSNTFKVLLNPRSTGQDKHRELEAKTSDINIRFTKRGK